MFWSQFYSLSFPFSNDLYSAVRETGETYGELDRRVVNVKF
jgi:hypothetical protein